MESAFGIIAEPNRRAILSLLAASEQSVSDIEHERTVREGLGRLRKLASEMPNARRAG